MSKEIQTVITLALPCFNEQDNIIAVLSESVRLLDGLKEPWEILVVDNHSSDGTQDVVREFARQEPRVRLVVHEQNRFYSGSCATILRESHGQYVAIMDSDGQFTAADLPAMMAKLKRGANLVFGWRHRRRDPLLRKLMSLVFNAMGKLYLGYPLHDLNVGIRMFDRRFIGAASIRHALNMANPELYVRARRANLVVAEVPTRHFERTKGQTCHNLAKFVRLFINVRNYFRSLSRELRETCLPMAGRAGSDLRVAARVGGASRH